MNFLVTGGLGFIGSHLVEELLITKDLDVEHIIVIDDADLSSDGSPLHKYCFNIFSAQKGVSIECANINDLHTVSSILDAYKISGIFHLAAETHVDNSFHNPKKFIDTNITGTQTLLTEALKYKKKYHLEKFRFLHVSTDEVYGPQYGNEYANEHSKYNPQNTYAATKAASDFLVTAAYNVHKLDTVITHCTNNYGIRQGPEKFIPTILNKLTHYEEIPVYGEGKQQRDWLNVKDHVKGLIKAFAYGKTGETYCFGTGKENLKSNIDIVHEIISVYNTLVPNFKKVNPNTVIDFVLDRPGHDFRYSIDPHKAIHELGWSVDTNNNFKEVVEWHLNNMILFEGYHRGRIGI